MAINYVKEIRAYWDNQYDNAEIMSDSLASYVSHEDAIDFVNETINQVYGATSFLVTMLYENEKVGVAEDIIALWDTVYSEKFVELKNSY